MTNLANRQALLVLHFPRLRLVWSRSLHATAQLFASLKLNHPDPEPAEAALVGVPNDRDEAETHLNEAAVDVLRRLPGITERYASFDCMRQLSCKRSGSCVSILSSHILKTAGTWGQSK